MRRLIWIVLAAAVGWSAWWFVGASALRRGIDAALVELDAAGWRIAMDDLRIRGFPNRFDTTIEAPRLSPPGGTVEWSAPFLQVLALSYRPNRIIVAFADEAAVSGSFGLAEIATDRARGSVTLAPDTRLGLRHSEFVVDRMTVTIGGATLRAEEILAATRLPANDDSGRSHDIGMSARDVVLPDALARAAGLDAGPGRVDLDATLGFARPIDRETLGAGVPPPERIEIDRMDIDWGGISLTGSGRLDVGASGLLEGVLDLELGNWREALALAARAGLVPEGQLPALSRGLDLLAGLSGEADTLAAPLAFREGRMFLGPIPVGVAPRIAP